MPVVEPETTASSVRSLRFGSAAGPARFDLQPNERRLLVDGKPAALGGRALDLLITLARQPDHLFTKNDLLDRVWPGLVVEEANLQVQISNLRKLVGADVIATVPGRGYRFVAAVEVERDAPAAVADAPVATARSGAASASATDANASATDANGARHAASTATPPGPATATPLAPAPATPPVPATATPAPNPLAPRLFGRAADLARLEHLLQDGGSVTLVGTSGVGKTSLARAAAARWPGRTAWVDLAPLTTGGQIGVSLARALGLQLAAGDAEPQLVTALQAAGALLVLDNAEHLVDACAELASLLAPLPGVSLLVTSQLPLAVAGEHVHRLEPLPTATPAQGASDLGDGALALLVERIRAADLRFQVTPAALPTLHALCAQLDGLPLALEMAAARVPLLGLQGVHDALAQRFALLTRGHRNAPARHRTLHDALEWSYRLLDAPEQRLFRALGVFAGGFTLDLAVAVATDDPATRWDVIENLAGLVDRSLVSVSADDPPRYRLLETMRAFALEQLAQSADPVDEAAIVRRRHGAALLALMAPDTAGNEQILAAGLAEMQNVHEAIAWARDNDLGLAAQLAVRAARFATFSVWRHELTQWLQALEPLMAQPAAARVAPHVQAAWWTQFARMLSLRADRRAAETARRAFELWRPLQQPRESLFAAVVWVRAYVQPGADLDAACAELQAVAAALTDLSTRERLQVQGALAKAALARGDHAAVLAGRLEEVRLARELNWQDAVDAAESNVVNALNALGRHAEAAARGQGLLARIETHDGATNGNLPWVFSSLMEALIRLGRLDEAQALVARACAAGQRFGTPVIAPLLALLAAAQRRFATAARLVGYARHAFASCGMSLEAGEEDLLATAHAAAAAALGAAQADTLVQEGRGKSDDEAAALAASSAA